MLNFTQLNATKKEKFQRQLYNIPLDSGRIKLRVSRSRGLNRDRARLGVSELRYPSLRQIRYTGKYQALRNGDILVRLLVRGRVAEHVNVG